MAGGDLFGAEAAPGAVVLDDHEATDILGGAAVAVTMILMPAR